MRVFFYFLVLIFIISSCQHSDLEFSCNPVINNFVKENQEELSVITLDEFVCYSLPIQKAIFNSWDAWKKRDMWIEKLERIASRDSISSEEVRYIQQLIEHIHTDYFIVELQEMDNEIRTQFAYQWINEVKMNLAWTDKFIVFLVYRLYTDESQFDNELSGLGSLEKSVSTNTECTCNQGADFCLFAICVQDDCGVVSGCGWLWSMECNGTCEDI